MAATTINMEFPSFNLIEGKPCFEHDLLEGLYLELVLVKYQRSMKSK